MAKAKRTVKPSTKNAKKKQVTAKVHEERTCSAASDNAGQKLTRPNLSSFVGKRSVQRLITLDSFRSLPPGSQERLLQLLPPADQTAFGSGHTSFLKNEYLSHACVDFQRRLSSGELTADGFPKKTRTIQRRIRRLTKSVSRSSKFASPKPSRGYKSKIGHKVVSKYLNVSRRSAKKNSVTRSSPSNHLWVNGRNRRVKKVLDLTSLKLSEDSESNLRQSLSLPSDALPKKDSERKIVDGAQSNTEPLPRLLINLATKKLTFIVKGKKAKIRTWADANGHAQNLADTVGVHGCASSTDSVTKSLTSCKDVGNRNITLRLDSPSTIFCRSGAVIRMYSLTESSAAKRQFSSSAEPSR